MTQNFRALVLSSMEQWSPVKDDRRLTKIYTTKSPWDLSMANRKLHYAHLKPWKDIRNWESFSAGFSTFNFMLG